MSITSALLQQHRHCDEFLAQAERAARAAQWHDCIAASQLFCQTTEAHFALEEESLFPAFEQVTGMRNGPTEVMRGEHAQARDLMQGLQEAANNHDADDFIGCAETLLILLQQHNMKEENILYPMCDRSIPEFAEQLA
ncbi:hemerythrin domain-containing protein [Chitinibacter fontanus]|uniref:Hemerythrin domain-containing protein n=1 Tax=Chitinibacter fontanus TaxID=1737446 RepID=A0A7D5VAQ1_9NEIS|nr:hemerythrin domain-containing protein [Chitinibacter fontanus]QLI82134.1 hemerythrin domain-containing protein [Chitinibacter fontanus]